MVASNTPQSLTVAVAHHSPLIRRSLVHGLTEIGIDSIEITLTEVNELEHTNLAGIALPLSHPSWSELPQRLPDTRLIALIDNEATDQFARAYSKRADGIAVIAWELDRMVKAVVDILDGFSPLPTKVAWELASEHEGPPTDVILSTTDCDLLQHLATGISVVDLAELMAYSEREMHRILQSLYERMGVTNRHQAVVKAAKWRICH